MRCMRPFWLCRSATAKTWLFGATKFHQRSVRNVIATMVGVRTLGMRLKSSQCENSYVRLALKVRQRALYVRFTSCAVTSRIIGKVAVYLANITGCTGGTIG